MKKMTFFSFIICALALSVSTVNAQSKSPSSNQADIRDADGNVYTTVTIGTQTWLVENLRTTKYRNGDEIGTTSTPDIDISAETSPKYQWVYRGNEANLANYGRLYTWYAATDPRQITPVGYRLPTDQDLIDLANYLIANGNLYSSDGLQNTGTVDAGNKIPKALASTSLWQSNTTAGSPGNDVASNNASGFNLVPGGRRMPAIYMWDYLNRGAYIWSSTETLTDATKAIPRWMFYNSTAFTTRPAGELKSAGMSIRCIKGDAPAGIKNIESNALKFQFYPSQVKDILTISFANAMTENVKLTILSTDGKLVYQNVYSSNGGLDKISVQLSHLKQGLYLCRVNSANVSNVVKFTKQ